MGSLDLKRSDVLGKIRKVSGDMENWTPDAMRN